MKTWSRIPIALGISGWVFAATVQASAALSAAPQTHSVKSGTAALATPQAVLVGTHPSHPPRRVIVLNGGFWWGWPYPYYTYPVSYVHPGESYEKVGKQWGKELKHGTVTMEQFVTFLRHDILKASDSSRSSFQVGFLKGYGKNGLSIYTQALSWPKDGAGTLDGGRVSWSPSRSLKGSVLG